MKVVLYMAQTLNGYIAKENGETPWSKEELDSYYKTVKKFGAIIVGRKTCEVMKEAGEFEKIGNPFIVVLSSKKIKDGNFNFVNSPKEAIKILEENGFREVLLSGGGKTNFSFIIDNLVDEVIIDIEPKLFGSGIKLFAENNFDKQLELIKIKKLSKNVIQLHYKVRK